MAPLHVIRNMDKPSYGSLRKTHRRDQLTKVQKKSTACTSAAAQQVSLSTVLL